jgi:hypothetical protein
MEINRTMLDGLVTNGMPGEKEKSRYELTKDFAIEANKIGIGFQEAKRLIKAVYERNMSNDVAKIFFDDILFTRRAMNMRGKL